jgi:hypothetical protein
VSKARSLSNPSYSIIALCEAGLVDVVVPKIGEIVSGGTWDPPVMGIKRWGGAECVYCDERLV